MAFSNNIKYYLHGDLDEIFDERGSSFLAMRKVQWAKEDEGSDPDKAKLELRRWTINGDKEQGLKGMTFLTEDGPHNLAKVLVSKGYGGTKELLKALVNRPDFKNSVKSLGELEEVEEDGEYFDMRDILLDYEAEEEVV